MEQTNQLQRVQPSGAIQQVTVDEIVNRIKTVQHILDRVMHPDVHYGYVGNRRPDPKLPKERQPKPTLLKAGAEVIGATFQLGRKMEKDVIELANCHREVVIKCTLFSLATGATVCESFGSCSTMESKYRYRTENTGKAPPEEWWQTHDKDCIGGADFFVDKKWNEQLNKTDWVICKKVEVRDPADVWNTVLKMAEKRAYVGAILAATACSDMFTQEEIDADPDEGPTEAERPQTEPQQTRQPKSAPKQNAPAKAHAPTSTAATGGDSDWREVEIHSGQSRGIKLGDLPKNKLWFFSEKWSPKTNPDGSITDPKDSKMKFAAIAGFKELEQAEKDQAGERDETPM